MNDNLYEFKYQVLTQLLRELNFWCECGINELINPIKKLHLLAFGYLALLNFFQSLFN